MDRAQLQSIVIAGIKEVQEDSGRAWTEIPGSSRVVGAIDGFESINGIEATCIIERIVIEQGLGKKVSVETLFTNGSRAHTLNEAVDILTKAIVGA